MSTVTASRGVEVSLLDSVITGTSIPVMIPVSSKNVRVHVRLYGGSVVGTLILEEALDSGYTGTWSLLQTVLIPPIGAGKERVIHIPGTFSAIRARISVDITGGGNIGVTLVSD